MQGGYTSNSYPLLSACQTSGFCFAMSTSPPSCSLALWSIMCPYPRKITPKNLPQHHLKRLTHHLLVYNDFLSWLFDPKSVVIVLRSRGILAREMEIRESFLLLPACFSLGHRAVLPRGIHTHTLTQPTPTHTQHTTHNTQDPRKRPRKKRQPAKPRSLGPCSFLLVLHLVLVRCSSTTPPPTSGASV